MLLLKPALHHPQLLKTLPHKNVQKVQMTKCNSLWLIFNILLWHLQWKVEKLHPLGGRRALLKKIQTTKKQKIFSDLHLKRTAQSLEATFILFLYSPTTGRIELNNTIEHTFSQGQLLYGSQTGRPRPVPTGLRPTNVSSLREINKKWKYKNVFIHSSKKIRASNQQVSAKKNTRSVSP